jgi:hypothetical protein
LKIFYKITQNASFQIQIAPLIIPLIISLTLLFSVLIIATTPVATGYELSIYDAYPISLWVLFSINIFFSIYTLIRSSDSQSRDLCCSYFSILLIETIILFLPIIRGYYSMSRGGGDIYYHLFVANQILNSGYLPLTDMYPIMHIWLSILHNFLPNFIILTLVLSTVFFILYIYSLYILGKTILGTKKGGIFVSIFGIPLIFSYSHYAFYPFLFALFIIPLILYAYQRIYQNFNQKNSFYICLVLLSFFIVFCHPMITVFLIIMFSVFSVYELFKRWKTSSHLSDIVAVNILTIIIITFSFWLIHFRDLLNTLQHIVSALIGQEVHRSIIEYHMNIVITSNASIWLVIDRFIKIYGPLGLYFSISLIFLSYIIYRHSQNKKIYKIDIIYSLQFCVALFIGLALITGYYVIFEPIRAASYGLVFATIMNGLFFYRIWLSNIAEKQRLRLIISISVVITLVCMLTMLTIYSSPWISTPSSALTYGDKNGIDWILEYRNTEIPIATEEDEGSMIPYSNYYYESTAGKFQNLIDYENVIPSNFGYNMNRTISDSLRYLPTKSLYMLTTEKMRLAPNAAEVDRRKLVKSFTNTDFISLKNDPIVNSVYSGNKFGVWSIDIP